jgi:hypothetical protein
MKSHMKARRNSAKRSAVRGIGIFVAIWQKLTGKSALTCPAPAAPESEGDNEMLGVLRFEAQLRAMHEIEVLRSAREYVVQSIGRCPSKPRIMMGVLDLHELEHISHCESCQYIAGSIRPRLSFRIREIFRRWSTAWVARVSAVLGRPAMVHFTFIALTFLAALPIYRSPHGHDEIGSSSNDHVSTNDIELGRVDALYADLLGDRVDIATGASMAAGTVGLTPLGDDTTRVDRHSRIQNARWQRAKREQERQKLLLTKRDPEETGNSSTNSAIIARRVVEYENQVESMDKRVKALQNVPLDELKRREEALAATIRIYSQFELLRALRAGEGEGNRELEPRRGPLRRDLPPVLRVSQSPARTSIIGASPSGGEKDVMSREEGTDDAETLSADPATSEVTLSDGAAATDRPLARGRNGGARAFIQHFASRLKKIMGPPLGLARSSFRHDGLTDASDFNDRSAKKGEPVTSTY